MQDQEATTANLLEKSDLDMANLPVSLGGKWQPDQFETWLQQRSNQEKASSIGSAFTFEAPKLDDSILHMNKAPRKIEELKSTSPRKFEELKSASPEPPTKRQKKSIGSSTKKPPPNTSSCPPKRAVPSLPVGTKPPPPSAIDPALEKHGIADLEKTLAALPTNARTGAYKKAKNEHADIFEKETNPRFFLQRNQYKSVEAANQLVDHWQKRVELFGDKAYLPLTQTGEGALGRNEMSVLASGPFLVLENDDNGRAVLCYDGSKSNIADYEVLRRVAFYMLAVANEMSKTDSIVLLLYTEGQNASVGPVFTDIMQVMPTQVAMVNVCLLYTSPSPRDLSTSRMPSSA